MHQGHDAAAGSPTSGNASAATIIAPSDTTTIIASGSRPRLIAAFQPAWQAAANRTAMKTKGSIRERSVLSHQQSETRARSDFALLIRTYLKIARRSRSAINVG